MYDNVSAHTCWDVEYATLCFNIWHLDELKVNWYDDIYNFIHKKWSFEKLPQGH
jgi:hypothetical protein